MSENIEAKLKKFGEYVRFRRLVMRKSQAQLGKDLGMTRQHISRYEHGEFNPMNHAEKLAEGLGITEAELWEKYNLC